MHARTHNCAHSHSHSHSHSKHTTRTHVHRSFVLLPLRLHALFAPPRPSSLSSCTCHNTAGHGRANMWGRSAHPEQHDQCIGARPSYHSACGHSRLSHITSRAFYLPKRTTACCCRFRHGFSLSLRLNQELGYRDMECSVYTVFINNSRLFVFGAAKSWLGLEKGSSIFHVAVSCCHSQARCWDMPHSMAQLITIVPLYPLGLTVRIQGRLPHSSILRNNLLFSQDQLTNCQVPTGRQTVRNRPLCACTPWLERTAYIHRKYSVHKYII